MIRNALFVTASLATIGIVVGCGQGKPRPAAATPSPTATASSTPAAKAATTPPATKPTGVKPLASAVTTPIAASAASVKKAAVKAPRLLGQGKLKPLFLKSIGEFKFKSLKEKTKPEQWIEYSATYKGKSKSQELKVVINEFLPDGSPSWKGLIKKLGQKDLKGYPAAFEQKGDKATWMVLVPTRFRVDFKSRELDRDALRELAKKFDFKGLEKLAR